MQLEHQSMTRPHTMRASPGSAAIAALRDHWPEYLIEAWGLGAFMVSVAVFTTLFDFPGSPVHQGIDDGTLRRVLTGIAMGLTAVALIYSPWGQRSGAHMNPAITLTFLRLGKVRRWDAAFYVVAQFVGGTIGVLLAAAVLRDAFAAPPVNYAATVPGPAGAWAALGAEFAISALMAFVVLSVSSNPRSARFTGLAAGALVAVFISVEAPLSGMSINPARSFASAAPGAMWSGFWIYMLGPMLGMQLGGLLHELCVGPRGTPCAKLIHGRRQRCIHCGYEPASA